jgi:hypothetical protein
MARGGVYHEQQQRCHSGHQRRHHPQAHHVTETVYRHVIVPAIRGGATVMDAVFGDADDADNGDGETGTTEAS